MLQFTLLNPSHSAEEIQGLLAALYTELFGKKAVLQHERIQHILLQWQQSPVQHWFYKVTQSSQLVGFFTVSETFAFFAGGPYGIINELWIAPAKRSQGLGKQMLQYISDLAKQQHWSRVDVSAPADEKWLRTFDFYQKNGLVFTGKKLKMIIDC